MAPPDSRGGRRARREHRPEEQQNVVIEFDPTVLDSNIADGQHYREVTLPGDRSESGTLSRRTTDNNDNDNVREDDDTRTRYTAVTAEEDLPAWERTADTILKAIGLLDDDDEDDRRRRYREETDAVSVAQRSCASRSRDFTSVTSAGCSRSHLYACSDNGHGHGHDYDDDDGSATRDDLTEAFTRRTSRRILQRLHENAPRSDGTVSRQSMYTVRPSSRRTAKSNRTEEFTETDFRAIMARDDCSTIFTLEDAEGCTVFSAVTARNEDGDVLSKLDYGQRPDRRSSNKQQQASTPAHLSTVAPADGDLEQSDNVAIYKHPESEHSKRSIIQRARKMGIRPFFARLAVAESQTRNKSAFGRGLWGARSAKTNKSVEGTSALRPIPERSFDEQFDRNGSHENSQYQPASRPNAFQRLARAFSSDEKDRRPPHRSRSRSKTRKETESSPRPRSSSLSRLRGLGSKSKSRSGTGKTSSQANGKRKKGSPITESATATTADKETAQQEARRASEHDTPSANSSSSNGVSFLYYDPKEQRATHEKQPVSVVAAADDHTINTIATKDKRNSLSIDTQSADFDEPVVSTGSLPGVEISLQDFIEQCNADGLDAGSPIRPEDGALVKSSASTVSTTSSSSTNLWMDVALMACSPLNGQIDTTETKAVTSHSPASESSGNSAWQAWLASMPTVPPPADIGMEKSMSEYLSNLRVRSMLRSHEAYVKSRVMDNVNSVSNALSTVTNSLGGNLENPGESKPIQRRKRSFLPSRDRSKKGVGKTKVSPAPNSPEGEAPKDALALIRSPFSWLRGEQTQSPGKSKKVKSKRASKHRSNRKKKGKDIPKTLQIALTKTKGNESTSPVQKADDEVPDGLMPEPQPQSSEPVLNGVQVLVTPNEGFSRMY